MKRILAFLCFVLLCAACVLSGCKKADAPTDGAAEPESAHHFSAWEIVKPADYSSEGELLRRCTDQGCAETETVFVKASSGLTYLTQNGKAYINGIGTFSGTILYLAALTPDGLPVGGVSASAFLDDRTLTDVVFDEGISYIGSSAFAGCTALKTVTLPNGVLMEEGAFCKCPRLFSVAFPAALDEIPANCFDECSALSALDLPDTVEKIGYSAFDLCTSLTAVRLPQALKAVGDNAFADCSALTEVFFNDRLESIGQYAFAGCTALTELVLPSSLTELKPRAFFKSTSLRSVFIPKEAVGLSAPEGLSPFYLTDPSLILSTDAPKRPEGWDEYFDVYIAYDKEDGGVDYVRLTVVYGVSAPGRT